jgi:hypothetical protein
MLTSYQNNDQESLYYLRIQIAVIEYLFAVENSVIGSRRLPFKSGEVKKTSPSGGDLQLQLDLLHSLR